MGGPRGRLLQQLFVHHAVKLLCNRKCTPHPDRDAVSRRDGSLRPHSAGFDICVTTFDGTVSLVRCPDRRGRRVTSSAAPAHSLPRRLVALPEMNPGLAEANDETHALGLAVEAWVAEKSGGLKSPIRPRARRARRGNSQRGKVGVCGNHHQA